MTAVVIYAFRSPGSGAVYLGKHECDPTGWPRRGNGRLPDGYPGRGKVVEHFHRRHGAKVQWRILTIVPVAGWPRAEKRAIHIARRIFGSRCVNIRDGGDGFTSEEARALCAAREADPALAAKHRVNLRANADAWNQSPEGRAHITALAASWNYSPEGRAAQAKARAKAASPEARAKAEATKRLRRQQQGRAMP